LIYLILKGKLKQTLKLKVIL